MNTKSLVGVGVVVLLVGGGAYFVKSQKPKDAMNPQVSNKQQSSTNDAAMMEKQKSRYVAYSPEAFARAQGKKRVLFFFAPWCPTCVPTDKEFASNMERIPQDVALFKVDYDSETELKKNYGITYQHTFVQVDENGDEIHKWNGGRLTELTANTR